ncbi:DUF2511 domain-containing protein [Aeromicrobium sp. CF4.19]|uniref:DUF2511 domain-containing protein n=1 Tax=Aeromicrobium sp. CF4.19 TaxID=3373082 RepID=UPI003EE5FEB1
MVKNTGRAIAAAFLVIVVSGCGGGSEEAPAPAETSESAAVNDSPYSYEFDGSGANVDESQFGDDWPLTVESGRVNCSPVGDTSGVEAVFTSDDEKRYALNGTAKGGAEANGYLMVDEIWADNPDFDGAKKDIGVLIDVCKPLL